jgi:hypothetical protein
MHDLDGGQLCAMVRNMRGTAAAPDPFPVVFCQVGDIDSRHCSSGLRNRLSGPTNAVRGPSPVSRSDVEAGRGSRCRRQPSEWVEAGLEQAELVAFGVGEDVPLLLAGLAYVGRACPKLQEAFEFGVLITVGGIDVDVQPGLPLLRLVPATEDDRRLRAAEPFARPDLDAVLLAIEHYEVQDLAPERPQHLRVAATEHELTDTACH